MQTNFFDEESNNPDRYNAQGSVVNDGATVEHDKNGQILNTIDTELDGNNNPKLNFPLTTMMQKAVTKILIINQ